MKKIFTLSAFLCIVLCASSQFIQQVTYRGAFAPAPTAMWTDGWANWDPQNTAYGAATVTVTGHITTNTTWTSNTVYMLSGPVYVDTLVSLTIQPGTVIRGNNLVANSCLIIKRGGKLFAEGTAASPIVFTSNLPVGSRNKGDWGGVILLGRARNNQVGGVGFIEGLAAGPDNAFGGTDDADNSGILKYVRIEYGGYVFGPNQEINGLTFGSIGSGTTIDYIQVSYSNDDSYEWFGGTVNCSHLVAYRGLDDDFDTDNGFSGAVQFGLGVRDPNVSDNPTVSTSEGFESDNDAGGSTNTPQTSAVFSNITEIGPYRGNPAAVVATGFRRGARLRRNTGLKIFNSVFMDYAIGLFIDGAAAIANANAGILKYSHNLVALAGPAQKVAEDAASKTVFTANSNDSLSTTAGILTTPYNFTAPDYRPAVNSPALLNFDFSDPVLPVELVKFTGENVKSDNYLYWETVTENNNRGFEIQKSVDGLTYSKIDFVPSLAIGGNSSTNLKYTFTDKNVISGELFYRLKQIDIDGRFKFSSVVLLSKALTSRMILSIAPNPVKNNLNMVITSAKQQNVTVILNDAFGKIITRKSLVLLRGKNTYKLDLGSVSTGSYYAIIVSSDGSANLVQKFVKE